MLDRMEQIEKKLGKLAKPGVPTATATSLLTRAISNAVARGASMARSAYVEQWPNEWDVGGVWRRLQAEHR